MAYQLKYYKDIQSHGHTWRLDIRQDTTEQLIPQEIGAVLQGFRLYVQGDQADIDTPIIKTSVEMVFVDAPDLNDNRKNGYWEEFFTSSATEYRVQLWKDGTVEWTGYVTPDSFSEDLRYRGSVTLVARDNLGAMQDYQFDLAGDSDGMVSLVDLIKGGLDAVKFGMAHNTAEGGQIAWAYATDATANPNIYDVRFNAESFRGKTWWEVVESVLYATGLTLRYAGENRYVLASIRNLGMGSQMYWADVEIKPVVFGAYGHRELSPAVKAIREDVSFDIEANIANTEMPEDAYGNKTSYTDQQGNTLPLHAITGGAYAKAAIETTAVLNVYEYDVHEDHQYGDGEIYDSSCVYIGANASNADYEARSLVYKIRLQPGAYSFQFDIDKILALYDDSTKIGYNDYNARLRYIRLQAEFAGDDSSYQTLLNHYDPTSGTTEGLTLNDLHWITGRVADASKNNANILYNDSTLPVNYKTPELKVETAGELVIKILSPLVTTASAEGGNARSSAKGQYAGITNMQVIVTDNNGIYVIDKNTVTTKYKESNSIVLTRSPKYAVNTTTLVSPKIVTNGILTKIGGKYKGAKNWQFNAVDTPKPLAVLIHQQMLAFYSKPNNVLTGEIVANDPTFNALYEWSGKKHLLMSGTLNILNGHMENAVLREFKRYDHMWETWVEREYFDIQGDEATYNTFVHSNKPITSADIKYLPSWATATIYQTVTSGLYGLTIKVQGNYTSEVRRGIFNVDTAFVVIDQRPAGDYGSDYYFDYS